jgi:hypothetical protein
MEFGDLDPCRICNFHNSHYCRDCPECIRKKEKEKELDVHRNGFKKVPKARV